MKRLLFAIILLATLTGFARLGETPNQCQKRYGIPIKAKNNNGMMVYSFRIDSFYIKVWFYKNKAVAIKYSRECENLSNTGKKTMCYLLPSDYVLNILSKKYKDTFKKIIPVKNDNAQHNYNPGCVYLLTTNSGAMFFIDDYFAARYQDALSKTRKL
jgi:hypothetical protein